ncbi:MAG: gas vesicle protein GvpA, partial [Isosphaeraceae bacterium]
VEARVVIASVETYLKYAEAIGLTATAASPA